YGKHLALSDIALRVESGEIVAVLGANGAGKTTMLKTIAGLLEPAPGASLKLGNVDLAALEPHEIVEAGVSLVPEERAVFSDLTVRENLLLGAYPARARQGEKAAMAILFPLSPTL